MKLLKSKGFTQFLCVTLCLLCMVVCVVTTGLGQQKAKQVKEPLSGKSELPRNQVIVYRIYYNEKDSPTIKVEHGNADTPINLKGSNDGNGSNHGG